MTIEDYQREAVKTAVYGEGELINYPVLGLVGEAGELANKYKKVLRDDGGKITEKRREDMVSELGDVLWYCAALSRDLGVPLAAIAEANIKKLHDRHARGKIQGEGDNR